VFSVEFIADKIFVIVIDYLGVCKHLFFHLSVIAAGILSVQIKESAFCLYQHAGLFLSRSNEAIALGNRNKREVEQHGKYLLPNPAAIVPQTDKPKIRLIETE
jgi:hypothetical protein